MMHGGNVWQGDDPGAWLDFSANLRPEGMPEWVKRTIAKASENARYYPEITMRDARKGLAAYAGVTEDEILPTPGGMAAIDAVLSVGRGKVLIDRCTFGEYAARAAAHGRPCTAADEKTPLNEGTRVLCNPNNPTGEAHSREEVLAMHKALSDCGGELVVDEAFIDFCPEFSVRRDVRAGLTVVGSLTKILCIPGVRLGYVCGSKELIARLSESALPWQLNAFAAASGTPVMDMTEEEAMEEFFTPKKQVMYADAQHSIQDEMDYDVQSWMETVPEWSLKTEAEKTLLQDFSTSRMTARHMEKK